MVAYPQDKEITRITEYTKVPFQDVSGTTYALEYSLPYQGGRVSEPYYPVLTEKSQKLYEKYVALAKKCKSLYFCGRLADFKYYNMDQALERALEVSRKLSCFSTKI